MKRFVAGLVLGLSLGAAAGAVAATVVGTDGYLMGWTVTKDGEEICSDPFAWKGTQELECD